ncbi:MAG: translesion DNA synthesis-associated protein ImuA [Burkholderiales bacterium]
MSAALENLLQNAAVWRGDEHSRVSAPAVSSGFPALDEKLGGWPVGALVELIPQHEGVGELSMLLPALARLSREERWITFVNPPHLPYAPALAVAGLNLSAILVVRAAGTADVLWAMEQALRSGACSAVLGWPGFVTEQAIRRLQLAAATGAALAFYFTAPGAQPRNSPVPFRLRIGAHNGATEVEILKRRGGGVTAPLILNDARVLKDVLAVPGFSAPADRAVPAGRHAA